MRYSFVVMVVLSSIQVTIAQDSAYLPREEFLYSTDQRYTFFGNTPKVHTDVELWPTVGVGALYTGMALALHYNQANAWWRDQTGTFKVIEDIEYARGLDKLGHMWSGFITSRISADMMMECGFNRESATLVGAGLGLAYMTYVEVNDGFAVEWGFSPSDAIANVAGVGFFVAQHYVPFLENFTPRWSYIPPTWTGDADINHRPATFIDDYNGTTFWLAADVNNLIPQSVEHLWPDWMMVSVGYGVRNYAIDVVGDDGSITQAPVSRRFLVGLDYNWVKILPESSIGFVNYLRQFLNFVRLPGPTLEFGDDGVKFGVLYPFAIVVPL